MIVLQNALRRRTSLSRVPVWLLLPLITLIVFPFSAHAASNSPGGQFQPQVSIRNTTLMGADGMMDEQEGWGIIDFDTLHTSDGGLTWQTVEQPHDPAQEFADRVWAFDGQTAWYDTQDFQTNGTNALYRTTDGGQHWMRFPNPFPLLNMSVIDPIDQQRAWVEITDLEEHHLFLVGAQDQPWQEVTMPVSTPIVGFSMEFISDQI